MGILKKKTEPLYTKPSDYSCFQAAAKGDVITKLSLIIFGLGNILNKQFVRGIVFLALEIAYFVYMAKFGITSLQNFITLGTVEQGQVYNEALGIYAISSLNEYAVFLCINFSVWMINRTDDQYQYGGKQIQCKRDRNRYC